MKLHEFDNYRYKKFRWFEIGLYVFLLSLGTCLFISDYDKEEITQNFLFAWVCVFISFGMLISWIFQAGYIKKRDELV